MTSVDPSAPDAGLRPHDPDCVFCAIVQRHPHAGTDAGDEVVYADEHVVVFLDISPLFHGHLLVCPRGHHETLDELPGELLTPLMAVVQRGVAVVRDALGADGAFVANNNVVSQSVPHLHVHVIPRNRGDGLRGFFWPRVRYGDDHPVETFRERLRAGFAEAT